MVASSPPKSGPRELSLDDDPAEGTQSPDAQSAKQSDLAAKKSDEVVQESKQASATQPTEKQGASKPSSGSKRVLIIEDEKAMAKAVELKLQKSGFTARAVFNGQEALNVLESEAFDLILLDILMPVVDGWQVLEKLKEKGVKAKIVITSNLSQQEDIEKAKQLGASDFLVKSNSSLTEIAEKVSSLLA